MRKRNLVFAFIATTAPFVAVGPSATACVLHNAQDDVWRSAPVSTAADGIAAGAPLFQVARVEALAP